ncbi:trigger factor [Halosquirtibacter xylanolyticus]|uniref:trigger factor n=1 Tax=Halosquirtibacter xylanolyticus TaxID=3374599 RepID=UPI00374996D7|nr:trigger factor [Prolixibacteraceae bacterium]
MKITRENIDDLNAVVRLTVEKNDYEATVNETLKEYRKKAQMPGFRQGKVPAGMVKKMYGQSLLAEEVNKVISKSLTDFIKSEDLDILGEPLPNDEETKSIDWAKDTDFEFVFDIALTPEINITLDKRSKLPYYTIKVDEQAIDNQVEAFANRFGENQPAEKVEEKETIKGSFVQVDAEGNEVADGIKVEDVTLAVDMIQDEEVKNSFIGATKDFEIVLNPKACFANAAQMFKVEDAEALDTTFKFVAEEVLTFVAHEVNEELFKKIYGEDTEINTVEAFRAKVKEEIEASFVYSSKYRFGVDARESLIKKAKFDLPAAFLKRWIVLTNKELTTEKVEEEWSNYEEGFKWELIKNKIVKENEIQVENQEVLELAKEAALMQFRQYGMFDVKDEYLDQYAASILENEQERTRFAERKLEEKVYDLILDKVNAEEKEVDQKEFDALFED